MVGLLGGRLGEGDGDVLGGARAGARVAPTGDLGRDGGGDAYGSVRAGARPGPTGGLRGEVKAACEGVRGQAQGLPLPEIWVGTEETTRMEV